jgi:DNA topoisomerase-6 subunit B
MGARQREISVSEFFTKNRHLLGFDNPRKALLTCVKEAVDNALDACEEAGILPDVTVRLEVVPIDGVTPPASQATRFRVTVTDNGPGIVRQQIPRIFAKLLYGSKFHRLRMSRGQQGIGISAAGMYAQLTTGKPVRIISRIGPRAAAHFFEVQIDTKKNEPLVHESKQIEWDQPRGTQVTMEIEGRYQRGRASVDEWLEQTSIANPHAKLTYYTPEGEIKEYARAYHELPPSPREIKPHPYGIEFGMFLKMVQETKSHTVAGFLASDFCRVSPPLADQICRQAKVSPEMKPRDLKGSAAETLYRTIQHTKLMAPPTNCLSPIGEKAILSGLYKQIKGEFYTAVTRPPAVYRGNPFVIEAGLAYGRRLDEQNKLEQPAAPRAEGEQEEDDVELARVIRYANRVPLLYQQSACATFKAVLGLSWKNYGVAQARGALPAGPMVIFVHMASVWVPFTSESKEAIADYDEIHKEITLALRECGRRLGIYLRRRERAASEYRRRNIFELYIDEVVEACNRLKGGILPKERLKRQLQAIAVSRTGGTKTDEVLGKTGEGPEGLPHSIIVTEGGVEGGAVVETKLDGSGEGAETVQNRDGNTDHGGGVASQSKAVSRAKAHGDQVGAIRQSREEGQGELFSGKDEKNKKGNGKRPSSTARQGAVRRSRKATA